MAGSLKQHMDLVEELIGSSAAFQAKVGAADLAGAREKILREGMTPGSDQPGATMDVARPFCVLLVDRHGYVQIDDGASVSLGGTGGIMAIFADNPSSPDPTPAAHKQSHDDFIDWVSQVMDEVTANVGRGSYNDVSMVMPPERPSLVDRGSDDYWICAYLFSWHINQGG